LFTLEHTLFEIMADLLTVHGLNKRVD